MLAEPEPVIEIAAPAAEPELAAVPEVLPESVAEPEPQPEASAAAETPGELPAVDLDSEFDPNDFLFGSEAETNGAAAAVVVADSAEELAAADEDAPGDAAAAGALAAKGTADPLKPIKSMTAEERIALFS